MDSNEKDRKQKMLSGKTNKAVEKKVSGNGIPNKGKPRNPNLRLVKNGDLPVKGKKTVEKKQQPGEGELRGQEKDALVSQKKEKEEAGGKSSKKDGNFNKKNNQQPEEDGTLSVKGKKKTKEKRKSLPKEKKQTGKKRLGKKQTKEKLQDKDIESKGKNAKQPEGGKGLQGKDAKQPEGGKGLQGKGIKQPKDGKGLQGKDAKQPEGGKGLQGKDAKQPEGGKGLQGKGAKQPEGGKGHPEKDAKQPEGGKGLQGKDAKQPEGGKEHPAKEVRKPEDEKGLQTKDKKQEKDSQKTKSVKKKGKGKKQSSKTKRQPSKAKKTAAKPKKEGLSAVKKPKLSLPKKEYQDKLDIGEWMVQNKSLIIMGLTAAAIICVLVGIYRYIVTAYEVTTVYVDGNVHYTNEEIMEMVMGGRYGNNSLYLAAKYKDKGIEGIPFVEKMDVNILSPDTIRISVYEKALAGYVEYLGRYMYFDRDGIVVESSEERTSGIPQVTGLKFDYIVLNDYLPVENDEIFKRILDITQLLNKYELMADKIFFDSTYELTLFFDGIRVTLGSDSNIDQKIIHLKNILPNLEGKTGTLRMENYTEGTKNITFLQE